MAKTAQSSKSAEPQKVVLSGKDFKRLITDVTRFPSVGGFAGSEMVNFRTVKNKLVAVTAGVVLSRAEAPIEKGMLQLVAVDERLLIPFAQVPNDTSKVIIEIAENEIHFRCRSRDVVAPVTPGTDHKVPGLPEGAEKITVTAQVAQRVGYLGTLAFNDASRSELCAVMLGTGGTAMACNQKAVAVLKCKVNGAGKTAIPLPLARILAKDDVLVVGAKETILLRGDCGYYMPTPVKAHKEFPVAQIEEYGKLQKSAVIRVKGDLFAAAIGECDSILSAIARTDICLELIPTEDKLEITSTNGGVRFNSTIPLLASHSKETLRAPLTELKAAAAFMAAEDQVTLHCGKQNGETFATFTAGWCMFPAWRQEKK